MNCTKCGKEIPEGESKLCEECEKSLLSEISQDETEKVEETKKEKKVKKEKKPKKEKKEKQPKEPSEKMKKLKEIIAKNISKLLIAIILIAFIVIVVNMITTEKVGNSIGNIRNYGYATKSGNWIYFLSPNETSTQVGIFKMKDGDKDQSSKKQLIMDEWDILSLNVSGNYLYFIGISPDSFSEEDDVDNKIYRMKTNGSDLQVINDNEFDNDCYEVYVINNKLYYIGTDHNIYKMNLDGSNRELVLENQTGYLGITDKYIIYNVENPNQADYITYIADITGENARPILENTRLYSVNIEGDYIYYTNDQKYICRVKVDGTDQSVLYEKTAYNMNVSGNYVYFLNYADEENSDYTVCVYRVKTNGKSEEPELVKELDTYSSFIDIIGNWIIYMDGNDTEGFINLVKTNGKSEIRVYSLNYEEYYEALEAETNDVETENDEGTEEVPEDNPEEEKPEEDVDVVTEKDETTSTEETNANTTEEVSSNVVEESKETTEKVENTVQ